MRRRILSIVLTICMVLTLVPQAAFAENAQVKYTPIAGTVKSGDERYGMLLDGDPDTKWCVPSFNDDAYIIFETFSAVNVSGYVITTGNDNEENPGRNPKNWILYGCNDYNESSVSGSWEVIHSVANDTVLQDKNKTEYHFVFDKTNTAYKYYKLQITEIQSGNVMQMSEFALIDCDHNWVSTTKPATCTEQGYTKEYCSKCNAVKKFDVIAGLLGHDFSGEGGKCIRCFKTKEELYRISVTTYATKAQLMDGTFKPYDNGTADLTGKLVFGKKSNGAPQKWFILGKDSGVNGDNTIIFAEDSIKKGQVFNSDKNDKGYAYDGGTGYGDNPYVTTVYANHYGASELRETLRKMTDGSNTTYFTHAEQNMMNATTVKTWDVRNNLEYTTTDKLYAANFTGTFGLSILVGSGSGIRLYVDPFWNSGDTFWLRAPASNSSDCALFALIGKYVDNKPLDRVIWGQGVRPAGNLNLSDVLFASAAKPSAEGITVGTIEAGEGMTLRMDGSSKKIGSVKYDDSSGVIFAETGTWVMSGPVSLIVQGNDGTRDWYFSKRLGITLGGETVFKDQIMAATGAIGISLADCKIWIEGTNSFEGITYAVPATEASIPVTTINSVKLTGMTPTAGQEFPAQASCSTTGIIPDKPEITYTTAEGVPVTGTADWETTYRATVSLGTFNFYEYQYVFGKEVTATVDGKLLSASLSPNGDGKITITREFTTEKRYGITDIKKPSVPTDNLFTNYYGYDGYAALPVNGSEFGKQATVTILDKKENTTKNKTVNVTWTTANNNGTDYDPTPGAANTFKWTVPASALADYDVTGCPGYDPASGTITGTVLIKNKVATPVNITGTDRSITYTETDIDVSQYFTIDSKAGTETYTLMDGGTGAGTLSGTALTVKGAGTFKIKVSTAANGIYAAGEKTITLTVKDGTIKYSASDYSGTYDGQKHSISVSVTTPTGSTVKYSTDGTNYGNVNPSFTDAGTYTVYFKIEEENYGAVEGCKTVTINKKAIRITAQDQDIVWGNGIDQSAYSVSENGIVTGDGIAEITLTSSTTALTDNGTISISDVKIENAADKDVTGNYNIATSNGTLRITHDMTLAPKKVETVKRKTSYIAGDALNVDDITVTAYYADGYSEAVTDFTTNAAAIDMATVGHKTLTISYAKNGETKNITITVSHNTALAPERIEAVKTTTSYMSGDTLNVDDIAVTAYYADGYREEVTDFTTNAASLDMSRAGEKTLTVSYSKNGKTRTADMTITVTGGGGGGGGYIPPVQKPIVKNDDNATTSADLSEITSTLGGTTTANIDKAIGDEIVDKAVENKSEEIVIDATAKNTTAADSTVIAQVSIPTAALKGIAEKTEADVTVKTDVAEIKMDNAAAGAIVEQAAGDTVQIILEKVDEKKNKVEFQLKVVCSDGNVISDFKGGNVAVTVTVPKDMAEKKVVCVFIDENGRMSKVKGQKNADGTYTFFTGHFSTYALMTEEEADTAIAAQKEEIHAKLDSYELVARSMACKSPSGKKAIRIRVYDKNGLSTDFFEGIEIYRSTKKNTGYGKKPIFVIKSGKSSYYNTAIKSGTKYYYRVRGFVIIDGQKYYTDYSLKAIRAAK